MPDPNSANIARFIHQYKGIEGFYFLNKNGELGFIDQESRRAMKELFPQADDTPLVSNEGPGGADVYAFAQLNTVDGTDGYLAIAPCILVNANA